MKDRRIREASPEDLSIVMALEKAIFPSPWTRAMLSAELAEDVFHIALLALEDETAVGFAFCWRIVDELHLVNLGVLREHRRSGCGQALLDAILTHRKAEGAAIVTLEVREANEAARAFYRHNGFNEIALRHRYYPDTGEDAVIMLKKLPSLPNPAPDESPR
jgi:ribosomal-protein-alanine N-acetyltransferase